jgi:predicted nucleotidyltransferase
MERDEIIQSLHRFKEHNKSKYQIVRLGIFGSVARGVMSSDSDVDVVVELKEPDLFF